MARARGLTAMQQAIDAALSGLASATLAEARIALRAAYSRFFVEPRSTGDGTSTMRQAWYREAKWRLVPYERRENYEKPMLVRYVLSTRPDLPAWKSKWWIDVRCDWCSAIKGDTRGCLMCATKRDSLAVFVATDEWQTIWRPALRDGSAHPGIFADWLDDRGDAVSTELARLFRTKGEK